MSQKANVIENSEELFNTQDLQQSEEINADQSTADIVINSEDYETQIEKSVQDSENYETQIDQPHTEDHETEINQDAENVMETDEHVEEEETVQDEISEEAMESGTTEATVTKKIPKANPDRITNLPLAKIKHIIKLDPDVKLVTNEAVFLITKTTEMFIKTLSKEAFTHAAQNKKKTLAKSHVDQALSMLPVEL